MPNDANGAPSFDLPEDLSALSAEELAQLEEDAVSAFDDVSSDENIDADGLAQATRLADAVEAIRGEQSARTESAEAARTQRESLLSRVHGNADAESGDAEVEAEDPAAPVEEPQPQLVAGTRQPRQTDSVRERRRPSLNDAQRRAPQVNLRDREPILVASADIPGFTQGGRIDDMMQLVRAMYVRARALPVSRGNGQRVPIASMERQHRFNIGPNATPREISDILTAATDVDTLIAAGGWCAPSEIRYDFFNIVCEDGMVDLPTVGVNRGGIQWPVSPSFGDLAGDIWTWTETMDVAAATGTAQSGIKTCHRVPCATFEEERLECDGLCLTVGNLTSDAFPELIANHIQLLMATKAHYTNARIITSLVNGSTAVNYSATGVGFVAPLLEAIEMQAIDYRSKYAMCEGAVLEVILPQWVAAGVRADLTRRLGVDSMMSIGDSVFNGWLSDRGVRVQYVSDWQVRGAGYLGQATASTGWPTSVKFLMYAPGTWLRGNGLSLDLGIIRDSVLNETNDHTAAWQEDCYLIAKVGHESRVVTVPVCANGTTHFGEALGCGSGPAVIS